MGKKEREFWKGIYTLATVGLNIVLATFIGLGLGWVIDHKLFHGRTAPWFTLIFLMLGIIAGFKNVFDIVREKGGTGDKKDEDDKEEQDNAPKK